MTSSRIEVFVNCESPGCSGLTALHSGSESPSGQNISVFCW